ncbi:aspartate--tRNA ligase, partial [Buchnera aphidicola]|nr:aspartate--tRNA ligase [Buchnera aphidicola]
MRNKYCGNINVIHLNKIVKLCGWVHKIRIFSHFIFMDLRDLTGIIQIIFEKNNSLLRSEE